MFSFENVSHQNRELVRSFIRQHWYSTQMVLRGDCIPLANCPGLLLRSEEGIIALLLYRITPSFLEILSLDCLCPNKGIGTALINSAIEIARNHRCRKVVVITTNDNLEALRFYQKRGFDLVLIRRDALTLSRKLKPSIPEIGENGIPICHELELEYYVEF